MSVPQKQSARPRAARSNGGSNIGGALCFWLGLGGAALLMMWEKRLSFGIPLGAVLMCVGVWGALDQMGLLRAPGKKSLATVIHAQPTIKLWSYALLASLAVLTGATIAAARGVLPGRGALAGLLITSASLSALLTAFGVADAAGVLPTVDPAPTTLRRLLRHPSLWLLGLAILLYVPYLGNYGLIDPWETHYGEVAREILARNDWLSLWWAQDGWFNSKPILDFWIQAIAFASLGANFHPDGFVSAVSRGLWPQPEWAPRLPMVLMALVAHAALYAGVKASWGRRAAFLGSVVWLATPFWFIIVHQTMTDLPYVAPMATAMGLFLLGFSVDPDQTMAFYKVRWGRSDWHISAKTAFFAALLICTLPQILYLASLNITLHTQHAPYGFNWHWDTFFAGSGGGNCGLPGNEACHQSAPVNLHPQPLISALLWTGLLALLAWMNRRETRVQRYYFLSAWVFIALSALAKELPGVIIALGAVGAWVFVSGRWDYLRRLEFPALLLILLVITVPWYLQETIRHGSPFLERLLVHDMYKRAFVHVHDTNAGDDVSFRYYIWQLGYGLFPASGLCAFGWFYWLALRNKAKPAGSFLFLWSLVAFGMFTLTLTKFHHYIIPMVPALAVATGPILHQALWRTAFPQGKRLVLYAVGVCAAAASLLFGVAWLIPVVKNAPAAHPILGCLLICVAIGLLAWSIRFLPITKHTTPPSSIGASLLVMGVGAALATVAIGRDLFRSLPNDVVGPMRLIHLVAYNYSRPWPTSLHFEPTLAAFTLAAVLGLLGLACSGKLRVHGTIFFGVVCVIWTGWSLNYYLIKIAPHWSQRETVIEYYKRRRSPEEWLVAYQMNWKGENIYTGNRVATFVSTGEKFKKWLDERRNSAFPTVFVTTEHTRVSSLKSEVGKHRKFDVLTDKDLNNKFTLVRIEL